MKSAPLRMFGVPPPKCRWLTPPWDGIAFDSSGKLAVEGDRDSARPGHNRGRWWCDSRNTSTASGKRARARRARAGRFGVSEPSHSAVLGFPDAVVKFGGRGIARVSRNVRERVFERSRLHRHFIAHRQRPGFDLHQELLVRRQLFQTRPHDRALGAYSLSGIPRGRSLLHPGPLSDENVAANLLFPLTRHFKSM